MTPRASSSPRQTVEGLLLPSQGQRRGSLVNRYRVSVLPDETVAMAAQKYKCI